MSAPVFALGLEWSLALAPWSLTATWKMGTVPRVRALGTHPRRVPRVAPWTCPRWTVPIFQLEIETCASGAFRLAKHPSKHVGKLRQKFLRSRGHLHQHVRSSLYLDLHVDLNLDLYPSLHRALLAKFYPQLLETFLESKLDSILANKLRWLHDLKHRDLLRPKLPPRQPVGRPLHGRIVAGERPTATCR